RNKTCQCLHTTAILAPIFPGRQAMRRWWTAFPSVLFIAAAIGVLDAQSPTDWVAVAGDRGSMKYTPVDQITPANVSKLAEAWNYEPGGASPIVINNIMYFVAGGNVTALNADTGKEAWKYQLTQGGAIRRGMSYWPGDASHPPRVLVTIGSGN